MQYIYLAWEWFQALTFLSVMCSAFVAATPTPRDDELWGKVYKYIEVMALTVGRAKEQHII